MNPLSPLSGSQKNLDNLRKACNELEGLFLHQLLREMRKGGAQGEGGLGESTATQLTRDLADETLTRHMAQGSHLGLGDMLFKQLAPLANQAQVHPLPTDKPGREVHP